MPSDLLNLNELDRLCKAAVAGPWRMLHSDQPDSRCDCAQVWTKDWMVATCDTQEHGEGFRRDVQMHNAAYIAAANPEVVGKLIAAVRALSAAFSEPGLEIHRQAVNGMMRATGIAPASVEAKP